MSYRKVGNMGRGDFDKLCNASGLIYNSSSEDDSGGWDAIVEFPLQAGVAMFNSLNEQPIQCFVQIKSTDGKNKGVQVKLSNMKRLCDTPFPCFFFFACYNGGFSITSAYLVHVDRDMMFQVMKRIRQNDIGKKSPLHKLTFKVNYSDKDLIELSNENALRQAIEKYIPLGIKRYCEDKLGNVGGIGYEENRYALGFKIASKDDYQSFVKATLGYPAKINIKDVKGWDTRFNINILLDEFTSDQAIIEIKSVDAFSTGFIRFEDESEDVCFNCEFYISPIALNAPDEFASFRIHTEFFDILVGIKNYQLKIDFESYDKPFHLPDLRELLLLMKMFSTPNGELKLTIKNNESNEVSYVASHNSFSEKPFANEIIKAEQTAITLIHVANYFRVDKNYKVSINELIHKEIDIERMHAFITKAPGSAPFLRLETPDFAGDIDSSKGLHIFIAVPLFFSTFSICLAFVAKGTFTHQGNVITFNDYEISIEKLIRAKDPQEIKKTCLDISDKINRRWGEDGLDYYYFNSFSQPKD